MEKREADKKQKQDFVSRKERVMKEIEEREYRIQGKTHYPSLIIIQLIIALFFFWVCHSYGDGSFLDWIAFGGMFLFQIFITSIVID